MNKKDKAKKFFNDPLARFLLVLFGIGLIFLIWYLVVLFIDNFLLDKGAINIFFPGPDVVIPVFFKMAGEKDTYVNIGYSLLRLFVSFGISFALALILGTLSGLFKPFETFMRPIIIFTRTLPPAVLIVTMLVLIPYETGLYVIVSFVMFPILYEAILSGFRNIDSLVINATRLECKMYSPRSLFKVLIPLASPYIFLGVVQTLGLGLKVSIMSEVMLKPAEHSKGIGTMFIHLEDTLRYDKMIAYSIYAVLVIALMDLFLGLIKKKIKELM